MTHRNERLDGMTLVIGATGTIGSEVFRRLTSAGERPRAFVRDPQRAPAGLDDAVEYVVGDLDRPETLEAGLAGVDRVFLLTRQSRRQPQQERNVIDAAVRAGASHLVKLSVFRADERSPLQIARQHREMERAVEQSGLSYTIVRPVFLMQNLLGMVRDGAIRTAAEDGRLAMVDARDVAAVAVATLKGRGHEGRTYTLTGPQSLTFDEVADIVAQQTGNRVRHLRVTADAVGQAVERAGMEVWFAEDMARLHRMLAAGYEDLLTDDVRVVTGTSPCTFAEFSSDYADRLANPTAATPPLSAVPSTTNALTGARNREQR
jgi:uncharacterized protein YbjT (DUF2867 family)